MSIRTEFEKLYDRTTGGWFLPPHLRHPFNPSCIDHWREEYPPNYAPVELEVGHFYYVMTKLLRPKLVLETGTHFGYSSYCIADALQENGEDGVLYTIDLVKEHHVFQGTEHKDRVVFINGHSMEVDMGVFVGRDPRRGPAGMPIFDMLVLDADHSYSGIIGEVNRFSPHLRVGGVMLLHDSMYFDGIGLVVQQLARTGYFDIVTLPTPRRHGVAGGRCPGVTIATKKAAFQEDFLDPDPMLLDVSVCLPGRTVLDPPLIGVG
ncbi:MAG TPA: class I SAM-dependent methyltransferase [Azospirillum sp.]|nr:class I SAM-dependent methyltransferase [Azospirillum sp.]